MTTSWNEVIPRNFLYISNCGLNEISECLFSTWYSSPTSTLFHICLCHKIHCLVSGHFCGHVSFILLGKTRGKPELLSYYFAIPDKKSELLKIMLVRTDKKPLGRKKPKSRTTILTYIFDMERALLQPANKLLQPAN